MNDLMHSQYRNKNRERKVQKVMHKGLLRAVHSDKVSKRKQAIVMENVLRDARLMRHKRGGK